MRVSFSPLCRCVIQLPTEIGGRLKTRLSNCNFMVGCEACWFDDDQVCAYVCEAWIKEWIRPRILEKNPRITFIAMLDPYF